MKTVQAGKIVEEDISTWVDALLAKERWESISQRAAHSMRLSGHSAGLRDYTYEITGVEGDYRIIKRDATPTNSRYAN